MTWFAIFENATGKLVSEGTVVADDAILTAKGLAKKALTFDPRVNTKRWNEATRDYDDVPAPKPVLEKSEFWQRFTDAEREAVLAAPTDTVLTQAQRNKAAAGIEYLRQLRAVDLGDDVVVRAVNGMETLGLIAVGRAGVILNG